MSEQERALALLVANAAPVALEGLRSFADDLGDQLTLFEVDERPLRVDAVIFHAPRVDDETLDDAEAFARRTPHPVLVLSHHQGVSRALRQRPLLLGLLTQAEGPSRFITVVRELLASRQERRPTEGATSSAAEVGHCSVCGRLTERQGEILRLVARGADNREIADTLFLSGNTVKSYLRTTYQHLHVHSRSQAILWALEHGIN